MRRLPLYPAIFRWFVVICFATPGTLVRANTITFETAPIGGFSGPVTESGFTYSTSSGGLFVNSAGNPGHNMEGLLGAGGGVVKIVSAGNFNFDRLDFGAAELEVESQTLRVEGFLGGASVGVDQYTVASDSGYHTEAASVLAGKMISELHISLNANTAQQFTERIDNVVLTSVPEPASLALFGAGLLGLRLVVGRKRGGCQN
jgi:PEP-CTERM motif